MSKASSNARRGWNGSKLRLTYNTGIALYVMSWDNPYPNRIIESIDFVSALNGAAPFLVGITLDDGNLEELRKELE